MCLACELPETQLICVLENFQIGLFVRIQNVSRTFALLHASFILFFWQMLSLSRYSDASFPHLVKLAADFRELRRLLEVKAEVAATCLGA